MNITPQQLSHAHVLVVGDVMLDRYWYGAVDRISPEAPVPVVRITREENRLGGCANVAYNVVSVGAKASLLSVVGDDEASHLLEDLVAKTGIAPHLGRDSQLKTTVKLRVIGRQQQLLRVDFENTPQNEVLASQTDQFMQLLPAHNVVLFSDYGKGGLAHVSQMIAAARAAGKAVLIDPKGSDYSRYAGATCITPNRAELEQVIGKWSSEVELMTLFDAQGELTVSAQAREVFDVTGAGDTVIATLATLVAADMTLREAMPLANKAGGVVVGKFGTATVSYEELMA
jgi:D-glycero-beta-D-manno-heptose-7-phosphate kinase